MVTTKLQDTIIHKVLTSDEETLLNILLYINAFQENYDDTKIDFDCFTPKTCEEAEKAILEVEEEIKAGKFVPIEVVLAETDKKIKEYENYNVRKMPVRVE